MYIFLSFGWGFRLQDDLPQAERDICLLAILLHDIGWAMIDLDRLFAEGFRGTNILQSDVRYLHEVEGVRLAKQVLQATGWAPDIVAQVCDIIVGRDTRPEPRYLNDRIVRDADKMWLYAVAGTAVGCDRFGETLAQDCLGNEAIGPKLETEPGRAMASVTLAEARRALMLHVL